MVLTLLGDKSEFIGNQQTKYCRCEVSLYHGKQFPLKIECFWKTYPLLVTFPPKLHLISAKLNSAGAQNFQLIRYSMENIKKVNMLSSCCWLISIECEWISSSKTHFHLAEEIEAPQCTLNCVVCT